MDYGEATLAQNKIFDPIKPETTAIIDHGITTRRAGHWKTSRCRRTHQSVLYSHRRPSRPRVVRPSATDAAPPRYPHVQGESVAFKTSRFAETARRGRGAGDYSFTGGELELP
jgi:transposase-like protein